MARTFVRTSAHADSSASVAHGIGTGDFTIVAWVRPTANTGYCCLWANGTYAPAWYFSNMGSAPIVYALGGGDHTFDTAVALHVWTHIVLRRTSGTIDCWLNGVQEASTFTATASVANGVQRIASSDGSVEGLSGDIYDPALFTRALSDNEIKALARGVRPHHLYPLPIWYPPLDGNDSPEPDFGTSHTSVTLTGSPAKSATNPPVVPFSRRTGSFLYVPAGSLDVESTTAAVKITPNTPTVSFGTLSKETTAAVVRVTPNTPAVSFGTLDVATTTAAVEIVPNTPTVELTYTTTPAAVLEVVPNTPAVSFGTLNLTTTTATVRITPNTPDVEIAGTAVESTAAVLEIVPNTPAVSFGTLAISTTTASAVIVPRTPAVTGSASPTNTRVSGWVG